MFLLPDKCHEKAEIFIQSQYLLLNWRSITFSNGFISFTKWLNRNKMRPFIQYQLTLVSEADEVSKPKKDVKYEASQGINIWITALFFLINQNSMRAIVFLWVKTKMNQTREFALLGTVILYIFLTSFSENILGKKNTLNLTFTLSQICKVLRLHLILATTHSRHLSVSINIVTFSWLKRNSLKNSNHNRSLFFFPIKKESKIQREMSLRWQNRSPRTSFPSGKY